MSTPEPPPYPGGDEANEPTPDQSGYPPPYPGGEPTPEQPGYPPPPPNFQASYARQPGLVPPNNRFAIPALILGILSITGLCCYGVGGPILGVPAIVLGHIGKREIRESGGTQGGQGLAQAGFITGIVGSVLGVLGFIAVVLFIGFASLADPSKL